MGWIIFICAWLAVVGVILRQSEDWGLVILASLLIWSLVGVLVLGAVQTEQRKKADVAFLVECEDLRFDGAQCAFMLKQRQQAREEADDAAAAAGAAVGLSIGKR